MQAARHALVPEHRIAAPREQVEHLAVARRDVVEAAAVEGDVAAHDAGEGEVVARHVDCRIDAEPRSASSWRPVGDRPIDS
jgi:hypothetical protein